MILTYPHPLLRRPTRPVEPQSPEARAAAAALREAFRTMAAHGLAANQIGISARVILVRLEGEELVLLNPQIAARTQEVVVDWEGCLSVPGIEAEVPRAKGVIVRAQDELGAHLELHLEDLEARILQHEVGHLDGELYVDLLPAGERRRLLADYRKAREGQRETVPSLP